MLEGNIKRGVQMNDVNFSVTNLRLICHIHHKSGLALIRSRTVRLQ